MRSSQPGHHIVFHLNKLTVRKRQQFHREEKILTNIKKL